MNQRKATTQPAIEKPSDTPSEVLTRETIKQILSLDTNTTTPLNNQEKRKLLTPELLADLTTEEYIALWRRLNPYFLTHVTRQGFRDNFSHHDTGHQEFHDGFTKILEDENMLRPPLFLSGLTTKDEEGVRKYLEEVLKEPTKEEALSELDYLLHETSASAPRYPDETAVHFAAQDVSDIYYGAEADNNIFFVFPSDVIASQYNFSFNHGAANFTKACDDAKWNDIFVWPTSLNNPGIPINSSIVFLPKNMPIDPDTGSKYASEVRTVDGEKKRVMIENEEMIDIFVQWVQGLDEQSSVMVAFKEYNNTEPSMRDRKKIDCLNIIVENLKQIGFLDDVAIKIANSIFIKLDIIKHLGISREGCICELEETATNWKRAENAIPAKEYWGSYFIKNPHLRPKHIVYYDGDPTRAIYEFQQEHNIGQVNTSDQEGDLLGFDDRHVNNMNKDQRANRGYNELIEMAHKIINEHYDKKQ